jgi:NAD(P)H dehydrogenase (quinone)
VTSQSDAKIVITGASGGLGRDIVAQFRRLAPGALFAVSVRNPGSVSELWTTDIEVRQGDFDLPETLDDAFSGANRLLIISTRGSNEARSRQHRNALDAAQRVGVGHVYYTSVVQRDGSAFMAARGHIETERDLKASGLAYTIFRNGNYIENLPMFLGFGIQDERLELPPDGPTAWVARADLAEAIARVMIEGRHAGETLLLTGPEALDFADVAKLVSATTDKRVERHVIGGDEFVRRLESRGVVTDVARLLETGFRSRAAGELAEIDPTLARILGRPPRTVAEVLPELLKATQDSKRLAVAD